MKNTVLGIALTASAAISAPAFAETTDLSAVLAAPATVEGAEKGEGYLKGSFDDETGAFTFRIEYSGLSGPVQAAHFHGPAEPGAKAGVAAPITADLESPVNGEVQLTDDKAAALLNGSYYVNLHTAANPGGEIRGQVVKADIVTLQGVLEGDGDGEGAIEATFDKTAKRLSYTATYEGLTGPVTAAHFHGPAEAGAKAGVAVPVTAALESPITGGATLTDSQAADLLKGAYYFNVHTAANPGGEIRGQVELAK